MNKKLIFIGIIAVIFIAVIIFYNDKMTLSEIILAFVSASTSIVAVYNWLVKEEVKKEFLNTVGIRYTTFKKSKNE